MITVICPVYNEENYITQLMDFFVSAQPADKELILIDGGSTDRTVERIEAYRLRHANIRLLHNPDQFVPFALNMAIRESHGDPIIRLDAHTHYDITYFTAILDCFKRTGADIVGGPMRAEGNTPFQRAVAYATSTPLGVGDSSFHDSTYEGPADTVYLGAWRRSVFGRVGMFDPDMLRNQDDEFHYRAKSKGCKIYLDPSIRSVYFPRSNFKSLFRQYFQYGLFKPLVIRKVNAGLRLRHLIPSGFVLYVLALPFAWLQPALLIPAACYLLLMLWFLIRYRFASGWWFLPLIYPALHISYGTGVLNGIYVLLSGRKPEL